MRVDLPFPEQSSDIGFHLLMSGAARPRGSNQYVVSSSFHSTGRSWKAITVVAAAVPLCCFGASHHERSLCSMKPGGKKEATQSECTGERTIHLVIPVSGRWLETAPKVLRRSYKLERFDRFPVVACCTTDCVPIFRQAYWRSSVRSYGLMPARSTSRCAPRRSYRRRCCWGGRWRAGFESRRFGATRDWPTSRATSTVMSTTTRTTRTRTRRAGIPALGKRELEFYDVGARARARHAPWIQVWWASHPPPYARPLWENRKEMARSVLCYSPLVCTGVLCSPWPTYLNV